MDKKLIPIGVEDFASIRIDNNYYVDKTQMIYDLVHDTKNAVTLFTRPRRFGKTLMMSMLDCFFNIQRRDGNELFDGLDIMKYPDFCKENMNQYPVIFISLKDVEGLTFDVAYDKLKDSIADYCKNIVTILGDDNVDSDDMETFKHLKAQNCTIAEVHNSLKTLMRMLYTVYGKKVILLIDEYDVPLARAHYNGYYREMLDVIRGLMSTSLKTNPYLKFAVVTGCLRIPKESIFTGVNNFASYSVMDEEFSQYYGFTQNEVEAFLTYYDLADKLEITKEWYDGYLFGSEEIYCPWDVSNFVKSLTKNRNIEPKNYWENTSSNNAIRAFFYMPDCDPSEKFETLLNGGTIRETITDALTYDHAYDSESNLWSVLLMTGYVTLAKPSQAASAQRELRIPNKEVATIFQTAVVDQFKTSIDETKLRDLMNALWERNAETASTLFSDFLWDTISYNDYHEDYYHAFLTGIFVGRGYSVNSNKERGLGRPDIDLRDRKKRRCIIIEAKHSESEKQMEHDCDQAIKQLRENQYALRLNGYTTVLRYGIAFYQKQAMIKLDPDELPN